MSNKVFADTERVWDFPESRGYVLQRQIWQSLTVEQFFLYTSALVESDHHTNESLNLLSHKIWLDWPNLCFWYRLCFYISLWTWIQNSKLYFLLVVSVSWRPAAPRISRSHKKISKSSKTLLSSYVSTQRLNFSSASAWRIQRPLGFWSG